MDQLKLGFNIFGAWKSINVEHVARVYSHDGSIRY
jgi:hypothetical protein